MTQDLAGNAAQIAYWNDAAGRTWAEFQDQLDRQTAPLGARAIEALGPMPGQRLLDVGCGCGQTTLALAQRVGPTGAVLGVDISQPMLAIARERASGEPRASFLEADAQVHRFGVGAFDAIHSRFGVMFFHDPVAAFANLQEALKPDGRLAFVCWRAMAENPIMAVPLAAAAPYLPVARPPEPGAPGPFAFADADRMRAILQQAGFQKISIEPQDMAAGGNRPEAALSLALRVGPLGALLREHPQARDRVIDEIRAALDRHVVDGRVFLPSATWIVTARKG